MGDEVSGRFSSAQFRLQDAHFLLGKLLLAKQVLSDGPVLFECVNIRHARGSQCRHHLGAPASIDLALLNFGLLPSFPRALGP